VEDLSKKDNKEIRLKNFVYADWNVILSLYSQLYEGVSEYTMAERSKGREAGVEAKGGLPFLKGGGHAELSTTDTETEKVLRHHDLYNHLEENLLEFGHSKYVSSDFDFSKWADFKDSDFLLVRPELIRFTNYKEMLALFQNSLPLITGMQKNANETTRQELVDELRELKKRHANITRQQEIKKELEQLDSITSDMTEEGLDLVAEFLGIRLKVLPNKAFNDKYFVCNCDPSLFTSSLDFLKNQYGVDIEGPWVVFGQVNVPVLDSAGFATSGNKLDDIFEQFFTQTQGEFFSLSGVAYPVVSLNPICIYRETTESLNKS